MTTARKLELIGAAVVLVLALVFLKGWILEREQRIRAEVTAQASEQVIAAKESAIHDRDAADRVYAEVHRQQAAQVTTPQQAAQVIVHYLPVPAPAPGQPTAPAQTITIAKPEQLSPELTAKLPVSPSYGVLTEGQLQQVARDELACDATRHTLATCEADSADLHAQLTATRTERDTWKTAAKGGTKFQRFVHVLKLTGCAAAGAGAGALIGQKAPALGATAGGAAGVAACSLF